MDCSDSTYVLLVPPKPCQPDLKLEVKECSEFVEMMETFKILRETATHCTQTEPSQALDSIAEKGTQTPHCDCMVSTSTQVLAEDRAGCESTSDNFTQTDSNCFSCPSTRDDTLLMANKGVTAKIPNEKIDKTGKRNIVRPLPWLTVSGPISNRPNARDVARVKKVTLVDYKVRKLSCSEEKPTEERSTQTQERHELMSQGQIDFIDLHMKRLKNLLARIAKERPSSCCTFAADYTSHITEMFQTLISGDFTEVMCRDNESLKGFQKCQYWSWTSDGNSLPANRGVAEEERREHRTINREHQEYRSTESEWAEHLIVEKDRKVFEICEREQTEGDSCDKERKECGSSETERGDHESSERERRERESSERIREENENFEREGKSFDMEWNESGESREEEAENHPPLVLEPNEQRASVPEHWMPQRVPVEGFAQAETGILLPRSWKWKKEKPKRFCPYVECGVQVDKNLFRHLRRRHEGVFPDGSDSSQNRTKQARSRVHNMWCGICKKFITYKNVKRHFRRWHSECDPTEIRNAKNPGYQNKLIKVLDRFERFAKAIRHGDVEKSAESVKTEVSEVVQHVLQTIGFVKRDPVSLAEKLNEIPVASTRAKRVTSLREFFRYLETNDVGLELYSTSEIRGVTMLLDSYVPRVVKSKKREQEKRINQDAVLQQGQHQKVLEILKDERHINNLDSVPNKTNYREIIGAVVTEIITRTNTRPMNLRKVTAKELDNPIFGPFASSGTEMYLVKLSRAKQASQTGELVLSRNLYVKFKEVCKFGNPDWRDDEPAMRKVNQSPYSSNDLSVITKTYLKQFGVDLGPQLLRQLAPTVACVLDRDSRASIAAAGCHTVGVVENAYEAAGRQMRALLGGVALKQLWNRLMSDSNETLEDCVRKGKEAFSSPTKRANQPGLKEEQEVLTQGESPPGSSHEEALVMIHPKKR